MVQRANRTLLASIARQTMKNLFVREIALAAIHIARWTRFERSELWTRFERSELSYLDLVQP